MIYLFGDLHGSENIYQFDKEMFPIGETLTKDDYVIILGDFGIPWFNINTNKYKQELDILKYLSNKPWTTLFIDGNHENFSNFKYFEKVKLLGGTAHKFEESVYHLIRGNIYTIEDKTFFAFGGALSIDKASRIEGLSWWKEEIPSDKEMEFGLNMLKKYGNRVNYILSHTSSNKLCKEVLNIMQEDVFIKDPVSKYFDIIEETIDYDKWFFGHFHINMINYKSDNGKEAYCLFKNYLGLDPKTNSIKIIGEV